MKSRKKMRKVGSSRPIRVALTGSLGSGKSTALKFFQKEGWDVLSADELVHEIYREEGQKLQALRENCLKSPDALTALEKKIHPKVRKKIFERMNRSKKPMIIEIPLLFEGGLHKRFDWTICIHTPRRERRRRAVKRGMKPKLFDFLDTRQWKPSEKALAADFVVWNLDGKLSSFRKRLKTLSALLKHSQK